MLNTYVYRSPEDTIMAYLGHMRYAVVIIRTHRNRAKRIGHNHTCISKQRRTAAGIEKCQIIKLCGQSEVIRIH